MWMSLKILKYILGSILEIAPSSLSSLLSDTPFIQSTLSTLVPNRYEAGSTTLYRVSSQIDVAKQVQSRGLDNLFRSSSLSLNIYK